jgi:uncharacterized protein YdeI (YjbR/CyaY-like superfamily)
MNPNVTQYIANAKLWKEELLAIRKILLETELVEDYKWSTPCYTHNNKNIVIIAPFKTYFALSFFNATAINDSANILIKAGANTQSGRQLRFKDCKEILDKKAIIKKYIKEAISIQDTNIVDTTKPAAPVVEVEELSTIFKSDVAFKKAFESLTPGRQRGYLIYFSGAKQSETRLTRIEKYRDRILDGIGITDCTCGLSKRMPNCDGSHKLLNKN